MKCARWILVCGAVLGLALAAAGCSGSGAGAADATGSLWQGEAWDGRTDLLASEPFDLAAIQGQLSRPETRAGSMVRGDVDLSKSSVQYFTQTASTESPAGTAAPEKDPLGIVDYGPVGELPIEMVKPTVYVMFNLPMVPLAKLGEPMTQSSFMKIEPAVPGVFRWYGTKVLSFEPDETLVANPRYTVTVDTSAKSLGGRNLDKSFSFEFHTEAVKGVNFYVGKDADLYVDSSEVPPPVGRFMILEFNQPVDPAHVRQFLKVDAGGKDLSFTTGRPAYPERLKSRTDRAVLVTLGAEPAQDLQVNLVLKDGASPQAGFPVRKGDQTFGFHTLTPFEVKGLESYAYDMPRNNKPGAVPVYVQFSHPLEAKAASLAYNVWVNGTAAKAVSADVFDAVLRLGVEGVEPEDRVKVQASATVHDIYGRTLGNPKTVVECQLPRPYPSIEFPYGFHQLESQFAPKFIWEARNIDSVSLGSMGKAGFGFDEDSKVDSTWPALKPVDTKGWRNNKTNYTVVDLKPWMNKDGFGTVYFNWAADWTWNNVPDSSANHFVIQVTDLGITTRYAWNRLLVWVNSLSTGKAVPDAQVKVTALDGTVLEARSDKDGLAVLDLKPGDFTSRFNLQYGYRLPITVTKGQDRADLEVSNTHNAWGDSTYGHSSPSDVERPVNRVFMFTDRGLYKSGEEIALRGIHWIQNPQGFKPYENGYTLSLKNPKDGSVLWTQSGKASISGGFAHRFKLPEDLEPGEYTIYYHQSTGAPIDYEATVNFTVAQFRKLSFQVNSTVPARTFYQGDETSVEVAASYLAGGAMPQASYNYYWTRKPMAYDPPGPQWKGLVFGPGNWEGEHTLTNGKGSLSASGTAAIREKTSGQNASGSAYDYVLETTVQDIDRQAIASTAHVTVHPASFYIGARFASGSSDGWWSRFVSTGQSVKVEGALVSPEGTAWNAGVPLTATILQGDWKETQQQGVYGRVNTRWEYVETEFSKQKVTAKDGKFSFDFSVKDSGDYLLAIEGKDKDGRTAKTVVRFYASGSSWVLRASETPSDITMILDKEEYLPGETARILVRSPVADGTYLMTIEREGIYEQKFIALKGGQTMLEVPVKESYVPVFYVALTSCTKREAKPGDYFEPDLGRPRSLFGVCGIRVSTKVVELDVEVMALKGSYQPGEKAEVAVKVTRNGQPVGNAEVSILAVDRGVLDLINYHIPNPLDFFYDPWNFPLAVHGDDSRRLLMKPVTYDTKSLTGGDGEKTDDDKEKTRKDFRPLALFEPFVATDKNGIAKVSFTLPDNLTTYRLTALALRENRLGFSEGELLVQNPINVRTALPRKWRNRDTAAAGVILQNLTREAQKVEVTVESDILTVGGDKTKTVEVPASSVYELPFVLSATTPGQGSISFSIKSGPLNERVKDTVIVEMPLVKEAFSTVGFIPKDTESAQEGLVIPSSIAPGYGSLSIKASASLATYLDPALDRLLEPINPWSSLYERLTHAFGAVYANTDLAEVDKLLSDLQARQQSDGGIYTGGYGFRPYVSDPYVSLLAAQLVNWAPDRGYPVKKSPDLDKLLNYLQGLKNPEKAANKITDPYFHAYNAWVLASAGRTDRDYLAKVEAYQDELGLGGYGLLAQAWIAAGDQGRAKTVFQRCKNFIMMGTQTVDLKETYEVKSYWSSGVAELALFMKNAQELGEPRELVQRVAGTLNKSRRHWQTRNDDLWTLLGFLPILDGDGPASGNARLDLSASGQNLGSLNTGGKDGFQTVLNFNEEPLAKLERDKTLSLDMKKSGPSPAYYTSTLRYALPGETVRPRDEGLEVTQVWETLDGKTVKESELKLGETYRVRTHVASTKRRANLELLVPVPSGVEIVDPGMKTSGRFANQGGTNSENIQVETVYGDTMDVAEEGYISFSDDDWYWYRYNPDSFVLDNMMVYRWVDFYAGTRTVSFLVRVTTPGIYPTPPAAASLQFEPEVFGRNEGKLFVIKP